jgi:hypothetical protein
MEGGIFLTVKDLMKLNGSNNYFSCAKQHRAVRDGIGKDKKKLRNTVSMRKLILSMYGSF